MLDFSDCTRTGISKLISRCAIFEHHFYQKLTHPVPDLDPAVVFVAGGNVGGGENTNSSNFVVLQGPSRTCSALPDLPHIIVANTVSTVGGRVVSCGGSGTPTRRECWLYNPDPAVNTWEVFATMTNRRVHAQALQRSESSFWIMGKFEKKLGIFLGI